MTVNKNIWQFNVLVNGSPYNTTRVEESFPASFPFFNIRVMIYIVCDFWKSQFKFAGLFYIFIVSVF